MSPRSRRSFLTTVGAASLATIAGCGMPGSEKPPAGSLRFVNDHDLPHTISMEVTGVGSRPGDAPNGVAGDTAVPSAQRELVASTVVQPGDSQTFEEIFTYEAWYGVKFTLDAEEPENNAGRTQFHPAPPEKDGWRFLSGKVYESGEFSWVVTSTTNKGSF